MKTNFDYYLESNADELSVTPALRTIILDARQALSELPGWEKGFHVFWLMGPFILLIERTPADVWVSLIALTFLVRSVVKRKGEWLQRFWVRAGFAFWLWCIFAGAVSDFPAYSIGEAVVWCRFRSLRWQRRSGSRVTDVYFTRCFCRLPWAL